jgi:uncharacterized protein (TIGR02145 family)
LLTFLIVNPVVGSSANALEGEELFNDLDSEEQAMATSDDDISAQADSGVTISFTPQSGSASLTPTTSDGASAKINVSANVKIASTGGYTIYLGGKNSALTGEKTGKTISAMSGSRPFANLDTNTWGYAYVEGSSVPDTATYSALPQGQGKSLASVSGNNTNVNRTFAISFATKIGNDKPADTYSNQVTLSVTSSPMEVAKIDDFGIENMQQMTTTVCANAKDTNGNGEIATQLKDTRDGKYYWVSKLADGKCWMTQNLDLDLSTSKTLTTVDSDVPAAGYKPAYDTATTASDSTILADNTGQRSWSLGNYRITNPNTSSDCGYPKNNASQCTGQFTAYNTPTTANGDVNAHYILGNHYQWNAATAGTGGLITSGQATNSICPKGWRLPTSNSGGELETLVNKLGGTSATNNVTQAPFYGVRGGYVYQNTNYLLLGAGYEGGYWSSIPDSNSPYAYNLYFSGPSNIIPSNDYGRYYGLSVRCIAR